MREMRRLTTDLAIAEARAVFADPHKRENFRQKAEGRNF